MTRCPPPGALSKHQLQNIKKTFYRAARLALKIAHSMEVYVYKHFKVSLSLAHRTPSFPHGILRKILPGVVSRSTLHIKFVYVYIHVIFSTVNNIQISEIHFYFWIKWKYRIAFDLSKIGFGIEYILTAPDILYLSARIETYFRGFGGRLPAQLRLSFTPDSMVKFERSNGQWFRKHNTIMPGHLVRSLSAPVPESSASLRFRIAHTQLTNSACGPVLYINLK